ncbi:MAG: ABC transporter substrate-binding protein [Candidatus Bathyarchaeia archaeon]
MGEAERPGRPRSPRAWMTFIILSIPILVSSFSPAAHGQGPEPRGAYADEIIFVHYLDESVAVKEVQSGNLHAYFWRVPLEMATQLRGDPSVNVHKTPGGILSLLLNPAPAPEGGLNPFSIREVRYSINRLIDRGYIVNEILKGYGAPIVSPLGPYDPDYSLVADELEALGIAYDPGSAEESISEAMKLAGAERIDGKWIFNGKPIELKLFIRSDDPIRKAIGETLAFELERAGFIVDRIFGDLIKAYDLVYGSDPKDQRWHLYTEGWGRSGFSEYDNVILSQMYSPWYGYMPGFGEPEYWNYRHQRLDEITKRITMGNFTSKEERERLFKEAALLGVGESVRIFLASTIEPYIVNRGIEGVVEDFGAGITSRWTLLNARPKGETGGRMRIGMKQIYQASWNPVGGLNDIYSRIIWQVVADPDIWNHPHTGKPLPVRVSWKVESAGPTGKLDVPPDAEVWDPFSEEWKPVGEGVKAISKVSFDLKYGNWHHGIPMSRADLLYWLYFLFEWGTGEGSGDPTFDPEYTPRAEPLVRALKGVRFLDEGRVEVYVDYWFFDEDHIASYASLWASTPWEIGAAMEKLVLGGRAAFSKSVSKARGVGWLSLIIRSDAELVREALAELRSERTIPKPLRGKVSLEEAIKRYDAAIGWIERRGHAVISNGPFYLEGYNPEARAVSIKAFKDPSYPISLGQWRSFEILRAAEVVGAEVPLALAKGMEATMRVKVSVGNEPSWEASVGYRIVNPRGFTIAKGSAKPVEPIGTFEIRLSGEETSALEPGSYVLKVFAITREAIKPSIFETALLISGGPLPEVPGRTEPTRQLDKALGTALAPLAIALSLALTAALMALLAKRARSKPKAQLASIKNG